MTKQSDWTTVAKVNEAIHDYGLRLKELAEMQSFPDSLLPKGNITVGTIGEYYAFIWLKHQFPEAVVSYGSSTEESWDIEVKTDDRRTLYQVKTVSLNSKQLRISNLQKGFDKLVVVILAEDYVPEDAYLLDSNFEFTKKKTFSVPYGRRPGSNIFSTNGENIKFDFSNSLADRL